LCLGGRTIFVCFGQTQPRLHEAKFELIYSQTCHSVKQFM